MMSAANASSAVSISSSVFVAPNEKRTVPLGTSPSSDARRSAVESDTRHDVPVSLELKRDLRVVAFDGRNRYDARATFNAGHSDGATPLMVARPSRKRFVKAIFTSCIF